MKIILKNYYAKFAMFAARVNFLSIVQGQAAGFEKTRVSLRFSFIFTKMKKLNVYKFYLFIADIC